MRRSRGGGGGILKILLLLLVGAALFLVLPGCGVVSAASLPAVAMIAVAALLLRLVRGLLQWIVLGFVATWVILTHLPGLVAQLLGNFAGGGAGGDQA